MGDRGAGQIINQRILQQRLHRLVKHCLQNGIAMRKLFIRCYSHRLTIAA
jgi:hypothetical protein